MCTETHFRSVLYPLSPCRRFDVKMRMRKPLRNQNL